MADKIRVGIVGATVTQGGSGWGANAHVPALKALPEYELKAVCTAHEETAKASAEKFGAELAFSNMDEMVARPGHRPRSSLRARTRPPRTRHEVAAGGQSHVL